MSPEPEMEQRLEQQVRRWDDARRRGRRTLVELAHLGSLGLMLVLPPVAGGYLGAWLDQHRAGYSVSWTTSLVVCGVFVGAYSVYQSLRTVSR